MEGYSDLERRLTFHAVTVAMMAKAGFLGAPDVARLRRLAARLTDESAVQRSAMRFLAVFDERRRDEGAMREAGCALLRDIELIWRPDPPDKHRRDIYG